MQVLVAPCRKKTGRRLNKCAVGSGDCPNVTLTEHAWAYKHPVDRDNAKVLDHNIHLKVTS